MRMVAVGILVVSLGSSACDRRQSTTGGTSEGTPAAAGTSVPRNAGEAAPSAAPAAAIGVGAQPAQPGSGTDVVSAAIPPDDWREVTIPAGTSLPIVLDTAIASDTSRVEAPVTAHLARPIAVGGVVVLRQGSRVSGVVTEATRAAKVKGLAHVAVAFDTLIPRGESDERYNIQAGRIARTAAATKKDDTVKILAPAVGGAIIGRILGGRKGAAIGAGAGAGGGTAVVMGTRGKEVRLGKGSALTLRLAEPVTIRIKQQ